MLRLLVVSDIHGAIAKARRLRDVSRDYTVVAGDIASCNSVEEAVSILEELASHGPPLVWVPGNCDSPSLLEADAPGFSIHGKAVKLGEVVFAGAGGSIYTPFGTPFEYSDEELASILEKALSSVGDSSHLALVVHTPPYGSGLDRVRGGEYVGSRRLRELLAKASPKPFMLATGHIHEAWGAACVEGVTAVNPGPLEAGRYALVEYDPGVKAVRVRLAKLS